MAAELGIRVWGLAIDFGTTVTAAVTVTGDRVSPLVLDGAGRMSSSVYASPPDGVLVVGQQADNDSGYAFDRFEPTPKRRISRPRVLLGGKSYEPVDLVAAILVRVLGEALSQHDGVAPGWVVLTHPVEWSPAQRELLVSAAGRAAARLGVVLPDPVLVPEPVAAAQWYALDTHHDPPGVGQRVAVYDLGGGTFDVAVLERTADGFTVVGSGGITPLGGFDFDYRLFTYVGDKHVKSVNSVLWQGLQRPDGADPEMGERRRRMQASVQLLKEALSTETSRSTYLPGVSDPVLVTREDFETLIAADVDRTMDELMDTLAENGLTPGDLAAIYRVGGASRIPLVGQKLEVLLAGRVRSIEDPKLVVALGASVTPDIRPATAVTSLLPPEPEPVHAAADPVDPPEPDIEIHTLAQPDDTDARDEPQTAPTRPRPWWRRRAIAIPAALVIIAVVVAATLYMTRESPRVPFTDLRNPTGVAVDSKGTVYVTESWLGLEAGQVLALAAGATSQTVLPFTGLGSPHGVAVDSKGTVYVTGSRQVVALAAGATSQTVLPFTGLSRPEGVAVDASGSVYVTDENRVVMLAAGAVTQTVLPFTGLSNSNGVAVDSDGNVYATSSDNGRVLVLAAGSTTQTVLPFTGLSRPEGVAVGGDGTVYVADSLNSRVVAMAKDSTTQTVVPFKGLSAPNDVAVDSNGTVYATTNENTVLKLPTG